MIAIPHPRDSSSQLNPRLLVSLGSHHRLEKNPLERKGRFSTFAEVKSGPRPLPVLPGNLCKLEISRLHHEDEGRSLGDLREVERRSLEGVATGRLEPMYQHPRPYDP